MNRVLLGAFSILMCVSVNAGLTFDPDKVKAVYIVRFANFIHWPQESSLKQINYCVVGNNQVTSTLEQILDQHQVRGIPVVYHQVSNQKQLDDCQLVYLTPESCSNIQLELERDGLVTVSDVRAFAESVGVVEFREKSGRIVPVINVDNAAKNNISIRSQLLRISKIVSAPQEDE
ncbi:YfiR family protein [Photobacterium kagoshimensis]|uniref:YfiR family protein n=1 Tax=Photobacterium kagoshimensis TaxID=2910242 RepID=UPI003D102655